MASFNKVRVKKLYLPTAHGSKKGFGNKPTLVTATASELNKMDGVTATTAEINALAGATATNNTSGKTAILDSGGILNLGGDLVATGTINGTQAITTIPGTLATAEHGPGAIGTAFAPRTYHGTVGGHIITEIHIDLTGLKAKGTAADDVIGLGAGGAAYIGRYVTSTYGIVYRMERMCLELPAGTNITADIDIAFNSSDALEYDGAAGASEFDQGTVTAGSVDVLETCGFTANDYIYLTEGDTAANEGTYTAGQFIIRFYGHAIIS